MHTYVHTRTHIHTHNIYIYTHANTGGGHDAWRHLSNKGRWGSPQASEPHPQQYEVSRYQPLQTWKIIIKPCNQKFKMWHLPFLLCYKFDPLFIIQSFVCITCHRHTVASLFALTWHLAKQMHLLPPPHSSLHASAGTQLFVVSACILTPCWYTTMAMS